MTSGPATANTGTPPAEVDISATLVRALLAEQHPDLAHLPVREAAIGWDNVMYRLGEHLCVRLPRRAAVAEIIANEQTHLAELAPHLPIPVPAAVRTGRPGQGYPWCYTIVPWLPGVEAARAPLEASEGPRLGAFLRALHQYPATSGPFNPARSIPLAERQDTTEARIANLARLGEAPNPALLEVWREALAAPMDVARSWIHGDLHARNVLSDNGQLSAVIDWGDIALGDRALDLIGLWTLLPNNSARQAALQAYGRVTPPTLARARGWAILIGAILVDTGLVDHPLHAAMGRSIFAQLEDDLAAS